MFVNKKIVVGISVALVSIAILITGVKTYFGDSATELPGEEQMENSLHLQESGDDTTDATEAGEVAESGEDEENEASGK